jgi:hypothetical protein
MQLLNEKEEQNIIESLKKDIKKSKDGIFSQILLFVKKNYISEEAAESLKRSFSIKDM